MVFKLTPNQIPQEVAEICVRLRQAGHQAWVVGGCVRDLLMGRAVSDWDVCTTAKPPQVRKVFSKVVPTGIQHGTVTVLWKEGAYEVTTLRGEGAYTDGRRPDEVFYVEDIEQDLARRDFTVNAVAYDPIDDTLVDPFGGLADLEAGIIRAVGVPAERFAEDGLRILRGARFVATLGFSLDPETEAAFGGALDTFAKVSHERVREEWVKTMRARCPSLAFQVMRRTGILERTCPLLLPLADHPVGPRNAWEVSLAALDASRPPPVQRLAALLHGVGRPRIGAKTYAAVSADLLGGWLKEYRFSNEEQRTVLHLIRHHRVDPTMDDRRLRRWLRDVGKPSAHAVLRLARAVTVGEGGDPALIDALKPRIEAAILLNVPTTVGDLEVDGHDVQKAGAQGRQIGKILRALLDEVVENPERNDRALLLARTEELLAPKTP